MVMGESGHKEKTQKIIIKKKKKKKFKKKLKNEKVEKQKTSN